MYSYMNSWHSSVSMGYVLCLHVVIGGLSKCKREMPLVMLKGVYDLIVIRGLVIEGYNVIGFYDLTKGLIELKKRLNKEDL